jgi:hypothetical protein
MTELERRLVSLGRELDYPPTPAFEHEYERRGARAQRQRSLALAFVVLLAAAGAVLALSPGARSAFLEIFRIRGAAVERVETLPALQAQRIDFGERVGREEAERRAGFPLLDLGSEPDAIFVRPDGLASVVYGDPARPRLVLSQARGAVYEGFVKKTGGRGTTIEAVTVDGQRGLFVDGADHFVMFRDEHGTISDERTYLAGTVLLWNRGPLLLRLEGDLAREEALALARSVE